MELLPFSKPIRDGHPYIVHLGTDRCWRSRLDLLDVGRGAGADRLDLTALGLDAPGPVTAEARRSLIEALTGRARRVGSTCCIVWDANACTHVLSDGSTVEGRRPPQADTLDPRDHDLVPMPLIDVWHIELPPGCTATHLCIRRLTPDWVEVSSGSPVTLACFDEGVEDGESDPAARFLDRQGRLVAPSTYRGAIVTGVRDEWTLLGPVQPDGEAFRIVRPWPDDVFKACEQIAGRRLEAELLDAAWRAVDPMQTGINFVGVLKAA